MAESRSLYRDSYKPPFRLVALIILAALAAGGYCICNAVGDNILLNVASGRCPVGETQDKIEWEQKPKVEGSYLIMSGRTKDDAQIHDVHARYDVGYFSAFSLISVENGVPEPELLAGVWPQDFKSQFEGAEEGRMFADVDGYDVTATEFYVKARLSDIVDSVLDNDLKVAVIVLKEQDPALGLAPLDAECIER